MDKVSELLGDARKGTLRPNPEWDKFMKQRVLEQQAEIDRLEADLFEVKREYVQRQEWSAKQTEVVIKGLKEEIDRLKSDFIRLHELATKWVDKDHQDWQELMKLRWGG